MALKKYYLPLSLIVLILGSVSLWVIIEKLPDWMGTTRNQHSFIDQLENQGAIDFKMKTIEGKEHAFSSFKGKIVILSFWASWCGPCVEEFPSMVSLLKQFPEKVVMVAISSDYTVEDINVFFTSLKIPKELSNLFVVWDPDHEISQKYQIQKLPESFIIGKDQKLLRKVVGSINWSDEDAVSFFKNQK
jgi:thiol-disulfide isomerase/thioredoxin